MIPKDYEPKEIPKSFPLKPSEILDIWNDVISEFGTYDLNYPIITYDEKIPIHFGTSLGGRMLINLYTIPKNIPKKRIGWWLKYGVLSHEIAHYHVCPYTDTYFYEYLYRVHRRFVKFDIRVKIAIVNYFSDLIVDYWLSDYFPDDYPKAQMFWYEWNDALSKANKTQTSILWKIMEGAMKCKWGQYTDCTHDNIDTYARKIHSIFSSEDSTTNMLESFLDIMEGILAKEFKLPSEAFYLFPNRGGGPNKSRTEGEIFTPKLRSDVSSLDAETERMKSIANLFDTFGKDSIRSLHHINLSKNIYESKRMWFSHKARSLLTYSVKKENIRERERIGVTEWKWGDPFSSLTITKSIIVNPIYPFPPYSRKYEEGIVPISGESGWYSDLLIVIDSSDSMGHTSMGNIKTPSDYACLSAIALLHAAYRRSVKINVINFSSIVFSTGWLVPEGDALERSERMIMTHIGGFTRFPVNKILEAITDNPNCIVVSITDGALFNWEEVIKKIGDLDTEFFIFSIERSNTNDQKIEENYERLERFGVHIFHIHKLSELPRLLLSTTPYI